MAIAEATFHISAAKLVTPFRCPQFPLRTGDVSKSGFMHAKMIEAQDIGKANCGEEQQQKGERIHDQICKVESGW